MAKKKIVGQVRYENVVDILGRKKVAAYDYQGGGLSKLLGVFSTRAQAKSGVKKIRRGK